jgi:enamine deaminase RidA (YjgF/YER057c/UK114 family)
MRRPIETSLPQGSAPIEWATEADGILYTAQIPIYSDGRIESGSALEQARLTFANLRQTLEGAGGTLDDVIQVIVYLTTKDAFAAMNQAWTEVFKAPYPNRATIIVAGLMVEGAVIEITATAHLKKS